MDAQDILRPANRLFVAADLPAPARAALASIGGDLAARMGGRAVPEASLHVTLDFLGRVPVQAGPAIVAAVSGALAGPPIPVALGGLRARPRASRAKLVAVVLDDPEGGLADRARQVREALDPLLGRTSDTAPLWPHVTVLRLGRAARLERVAAPLGREHVFDVGRGALYDSLQSPGGPPRYRELAAVEFAPVP
jgi:RNA 2',3'-cyclic 3'-phosphodiesterase